MNYMLHYHSCINKTPKKKKFFRHVIIFIDQKQETTKPQVIKRGQRGKLKKIKEKYKDQDEYEKEMRIKLLQVIMEYIINYYSTRISYIAGICRSTKVLSRRHIFILFNM